MHPHRPAVTQRHWRAVRPTPDAEASSATLAPGRSSRTPSTAARLGPRGAPAPLQRRRMLERGRGGHPRRGCRPG
jgi:hypothetical protein